MTETADETDDRRISERLHDVLSMIMCPIAGCWGLHGAELIAPVPGRAPQVGAEELTLDDFAHNEVTGSVEAYPASHLPLRVTREETTQTTVVEMSAAVCASCPLLKLCPIHRTPDGRFELKFTDLSGRRKLAGRP